VYATTILVLEHFGYIIPESLSGALKVSTQLFVLLLDLLWCIFYEAVLLSNLDGLAFDLVREFNDFWISDSVMRSIARINWSLSSNEARVNPSAEGSLSRNASCVLKPTRWFWYAFCRHLVSGSCLMTWSTIELGATISRAFAFLCRRQYDVYFSSDPKSDPILSR